MNGLSVSTLRHRTPRLPSPQAPEPAETRLSALRWALILRSGRTSARRPRARPCATPPGPRRLRRDRRSRRPQQPAHHLRRRRLADHDRPQRHRLVAVRTGPAVHLEHPLQQFSPAPPLLGARRRLPPVLRLHQLERGARLALGLGRGGHPRHHVGPQCRVAGEHASVEHLVRAWRRDDRRQLLERCSTSRSLSSETPAGRTRRGCWTTTGP